MDVSCSLDILVRQGSPVSERLDRHDPLTAVIRETHEKMEKAFQRKGKITARRKVVS